MQMIFIHIDRKLVRSGDLQKWGCQNVSCFVAADQELVAETRGSDFLEPTHAHGFARRPSGPFQAAATNLLDMTPAIRIEYSERFLQLEGILILIGLCRCTGIFLHMLKIQDPPR